MTAPLHPLLKHNFSNYYIYIIQRLLSSVIQTIVIQTGYMDIVLSVFYLIIKVAPMFSLHFTEHKSFKTIANKHKNTKLTEPSLS